MTMNAGSRAGVGLTFQVQMGVPYVARVSRVLQPLRGRSRLSNLSVKSGDVLTSINGRDVAGFPKNLLRHYLLGPVSLSGCRLQVE